jgi:hypothetical protein
MKQARMLILAALAAAPLAHAEFVLDVDNPQFRVIVPSIPQMKMDPHPGHKEHPNLRLMGIDGPWLLNVNTPDADPGMKAQDCAQAIASALPKRPGVPPQDQIYKNKLDPNTYIAAYVAPRKAGQMQLNAHLISQVGKYCVEFHAAKVTDSLEEAKVWFKSFKGAKIEARDGPAQAAQAPAATSAH